MTTSFLKDPLVFAVLASFLGFLFLSLTSCPGSVWYRLTVVRVRTTVGTGTVPSVCWGWDQTQWRLEESPFPSLEHLISIVHVHVHEVKELLCSRILVLT